MKGLLSDFADNSEMELLHNKMKYCVHKDDLVVGLTKQSYSGQPKLYSTTKRAYPPVISNLAR